MFLPKNASGFYFSEDRTRAFGPENWYGLPLFERVKDGYEVTAFAANCGAAFRWLEDGNLGTGRHHT